MRSPFAILCFLTLASGAALLFLLAPSVAASTPPLPGGALLFYQIALLCAALCAQPLLDPATREAPVRKTALTAARALRWIALAAVPSALLHALVRYSGVDAGAALTLYIGTFLLAFYGPSEAVGRFARRLSLLPILAGGLGLALTRFTPADAPAVALVAALALAAFVFAAAGCHCELARQKPDASRQTFFALAVVLGAALGGLAQQLFAPGAVFAAGLILAGLAMGAEKEKRTLRLRPQVLAALAALTLGVALSAVPPNSDKGEAVLQLRGLLD